MNWPANEGEMGDADTPPVPLARGRLSDLGAEADLAGGFTEAERRTLLSLARRTLERAVAGETAPEGQSANYTGILAQKRGCFVTLTKATELRGCIGQITTETPLYEAIAENTTGAALRDLRFECVQPDELSAIRIEISVLTEPTPLVYTSPEDLLDQLQPPRDGVVLRVGGRMSTFLPKVWEIIPDKIEFMQRLAQKAGCSASAWRDPDARVLIYHTESFQEPLAAQPYV